MDTITVTPFVPKEPRISESLKTLRTNLMFSGPSVRVIGFTSFAPGEGKTTISLQTAISFAQLGKRVLLVDADLRKSVLAGQLRLKTKVEGLSHYLSGLANVSELIQETDIPGLYIMFAGVRVPNSTELLGSENFARLIPALKDVFDYVVVDTAPIGQIIDCALMAPHLDGVVMVIDASHNSYKLERRVKNQIEKSGGKVLGAVLNQVDTSHDRGYYGKYYGGYNYYVDNE
ncbi:MAG: polysaccharide biosynthesis tyrosine autokinase [Oscillospiraceae bacterium]|nr:polysaccharide biosynthesis tyrosine autokinase [Oscillospiraceae bacterium]